MESESVHLNLVVVAATGTRFYFSCTSITNPSSRPQGLQLIHVRLPPGYAANAPVMRPRKVQMAYYRKGELFFHNVTNTFDLIYSIEIFFFRNPLSCLRW